VNILDTSALIELISGRPTAIKIMEAIGSEIVVTTALSMHELLVGLKKKEEQIFSKVQQSILVLGYNDEACKISASIFKELKQKGNMINQMDILIAAICKENNATIVTLDKDFKKVPGLKVKLIA